MGLAQRRSKQLKNTAYATGYSEGFAFGLISDAQGPAALILTKLTALGARPEGEPDRFWLSYRKLV
jgi:hypothetical protein